MQDIRYALRSLRRNQSMTVIAVITLALGIGSSTLVFSIVEAALLRPLPFRDPGRLVQVWETRTERGITQSSFAEANFWDVRSQSRSFQEMAASSYYEANLTGAGPAEKVTGSAVTAGFFRTLGISPFIGRDFSYDEVGAGFASHVVVVGESFWKQRLGGDRGVIGKGLRLDGNVYTVVGVVRTTEPFLDGDVYVPFGYSAQARRSSWEYSVIGRLAPGVSRQDAESDLAHVAAGLAAVYPKDDKGIGFAIAASDQWIAPSATRRAIWVLLGAVSLLLLIAAVNTANLLLARGSARQREIAVRTALGASRMRLVRFVMTESVLLSVIGTLLGVTLAYAGLQAVRLLEVRGVPRLQDANLNVPVLIFAVAVALLTGLISGAAPCLQLPVSGIVTSLRDGDRQTGSRHQGRVRTWLVALEVGLSFVLLVAAGLMIRTFTHLIKIERGFHTEGRLVFSANIPSSYLQQGVGKQFLDRLREQLSAVPGVVAAGAVSQRPMEGGDPGMEIDSPSLGATRQKSPWAGWRIVTPGYFSAVGLEILRGRAFEDNDRWGDQRDPGRPKRIMISDRLARLIFPNEDAIGKPVLLWKGQGNMTGEVIGVVADSRERGPAADVSLTVYIPYGPGMLPNEFFVHTREDPAKLGPTVRAIVAGLDPNIPVSDMRSFDDVVSRTVAPQRFGATLLGVFSLLALVLATTGVYGVLSYSIGRRTSEIGLHMALGATAASILRMTMGQGIRPAIAGLCAGALAAILLSRYMTGMLVGVQPLDPLTYVLGSGLLIVTGLIACYIPARRAMQTDPALALRAE